MKLCEKNAVDYIELPAAYDARAAVKAFIDFFRVVLPAALSGIMASIVLAVSRAVGETMIVAIAAGQEPRLTLDPTVPVEAMTAFIVQVSMGDTPTGTLEYRTLFAVGISLFLLTFVMNIISQRLARRLRQAH